MGHLSAKLLNGIKPYTLWYITEMWLQVLLLLEGPGLSKLVLDIIIRAMLIELVLSVSVELLIKVVSFDIDFGYDCFRMMK